MTLSGSKHGLPSWSIFVRSRYTIKTPPINELYTVLKEWISNRQPGGLIIGEPRVGKTYGVRYVCHALQFTLCKIRWFEVPCRLGYLNRESAFFQHLLACTRSKDASKGKTADKRERLTERLYEQALRSPLNAVILFLDEAQFLYEEQYNWLINISNELDKNGVALICLLVGQPQLYVRRKAIAEENQHQIIGRFMVGETRFRGLETPGDITRCLKEYDNTEFPPESGKKLIEFMAPGLWEKGWQLESMSEAIWLAFSEVWKEVGRSDPLEIPMKYFSGAVERFLGDLALNDSAVIFPKIEEAIQAVNKSGYPASLRWTRVKKS